MHTLIHSRLFIIPAAGVFWPILSQELCFCCFTCCMLSALELGVLRCEDLLAPPFLLSSFLCRHDLAGSGSIRTCRRKVLSTWMAPVFVFSSWPSALPNSSVEEGLYSGSTCSCSSSGIFPISRLSSRVSVQT